VKSGAGEFGVVPLRSFVKIGILWGRYWICLTPFVLPVRVKFGTRDCEGGLRVEEITFPQVP
jgi:hypothetical protein